MQGSPKPPVGERLEAAGSDGGSERNNRPTFRRDDRAEPDDDIGSAPRIDVVNVEGPPSSSRGVAGNDENAASGLGSLRRELAKLNQQAAAVEKSLDEQRRERSDALERVERATERAIQLEARIASLELEVTTQRKLRATSLAEREAMRAERDELAHVVETAKASTSQLTPLREDVERLRARNLELERASEGLANELAELRKRQFLESLKVTDKELELAKLRPAFEQVTAEIAEARAEAAKAKAELAATREGTEKSEQDLAKAREEAMDLRARIARAKEDNARDRATARERIDAIERALEESRATAIQLEDEIEASRRVTAALKGELTATRANEEALGHKLEATTIAAMEAEARATASAAAHAGLEQSLRFLREEIAGAFSRIGRVPSSPESAPIVELSSPLAGSLPADVDAPRASDEQSAEAHGEEAPSSPASRSVPPPPSVVVAPPEGRASIPPPTYASVPPQVHESKAPANTIEANTIESVVPPTRRVGASAFPPAMTTAGLVTREELIARLVDPDHADEAALELKQHPDWLRDSPPPSFLAALASVDFDAESPTFDLARVWEREPLCHALIASLRAERESRQREHFAWLLKHFAAPSSWRAIADVAMSEQDSVQLRRWLLEALDRLAAGRAIGWNELGEVVTSVARHADASLRDGVVGILVSLDRSEEKRRLLLDILRADDNEIVLASAVDALASVLPMELDPSVVERLLGHPSERVQRSVKELIERAKQTK